LALDVSCPRFGRSDGDPLELRFIFFAGPAWLDFLSFRRFPMMRVRWVVERGWRCGHLSTGLQVDYVFEKAGSEKIVTMWKAVYHSLVAAVIG